MKILHQHTLLARPVGRSQTSMTRPDDIVNPTEVSQENAIPVSMDQLSDEQKQQLEQRMVEFQKLCLGSFTKSRHGSVHQKGPLPPATIPENVAVHETSETSMEELPKQTFQDVVDQAVHHALVNQSQTLVNTLKNLILKTVDGSVYKEHPQGPAYFASPNNGMPMSGSYTVPTQGGNPTSAPEATYRSLPQVLQREAPSQSIPQSRYPTSAYDMPQASAPPRSPFVTYTTVPDVDPRMFPKSTSAPVAGQQGFHTAANYGGESRTYMQAAGQTSGSGTTGADEWANKIAEVMREQFGLKPKQQAHVYRPPYPEAFDMMPLPHRYRMPDFAKFTGQDDTSTREHISRFLAQCGEASAVDALKVRFFPLSLSGSAFSWFASLPPNSVQSWADLEQKFHKYFFAEVREMRIIDLMAVKQRAGESVAEYVQRFRDVRSKCFSLQLTDAQLADLAFNGLVGPLRDRIQSPECDSLAQLVQKASAQENQSRGIKGKYSVVQLADYSSGSDSEEEVALAEWTRNKKAVSCPWAKKDLPGEQYNFDIKKADKMFDLLLQEKLIQLPANHVMPPAEELKKKRWCKWHNSPSHHTNDCKVFRQQIQSAIEQGRIKFDDQKKPMKIDGHPFPANVSMAGIEGSSALIKRYQKKREREEGVFRGSQLDPHWNCPFFRFCWDQGMKLPSINDCPGCSDRGKNRYREQSAGHQASRQRVEEVGRSHRGEQGLGHRPEAAIQARVSVHERLGPIGVSKYDFDREVDSELRRGTNERQEPKEQWCPQGIFTKSQKRRAQRLRHRELKADGVYNHIDREDHRPQTKKVWRPKLKSQVHQPEASINMVFILPQEFMAPEYSTDSDEEVTAQLILDPQQAVFEKPEEAKHRHLKALYMNGFVNGKPMGRMLVDGGAAVNIMPMTTLRKLGKNADDLTKTNMMLRDYGGGTSEAKGVLNVELTVGSKTLPVSFFVIEGKGAYSLLLGRDWIHANCCVPSTMHQVLIQWVGDRVEVVPADKALNVATADPSPWQTDDMECLSGKNWEGEYVKITNQGLEVIDEVNSKLFL